MNKLIISKNHIPAKAKLYEKGVLVKQWSMDEPESFLMNFIQNQDVSVFEKIRLLRMSTKALELFKPNTIEIIEKENQENGK